MDPAALAVFAGMNRTSLDFDSLGEIAKYTNVPILATALTDINSNVLKEAIETTETQKLNMNPHH
jgi:hypothetical protein